MNNREIIIISAVNIIEGGTLTILNNCLQYLNDSELSRIYRIIAIVHIKSMFKFDNIEYMEISKAKKSWMNRIYYEYIYFRKLSRKLMPYLWFSLHDITPFVFAQKRAVYCHNPSPFYKIGIRDFYFDIKLVLFSIFYKYLYGLNLKKNNYVVVQQDWIRNKFVKMYKIEMEKIIVAHPNIVTKSLPKNNLTYIIICIML